MHEVADAAAVSRRKLIGVLFSFSAAISYGTSQVMTRAATEETSPLVGGLIALLFGTAGFALLSARTLARNRGGDGNMRRGILYVIGGGIFSASGVLLMFLALQRGEVVTVAPVVATNPLFTLAFAIVLLRGVERVTKRIALGALLVVAGVVILTLA